MLLLIQEQSNQIKQIYLGQTGAAERKGVYQGKELGYILIANILLGLVDQTYFFLSYQ